MEPKRAGKAVPPQYPTFQDYWEQRQKCMGAVAVTAGLTLGVGLLSGCERQPAPLEEDVPVNPSVSTHQLPRIQGTQPPPRNARSVNPPSARQQRVEPPRLSGVPPRPGDPPAPEAP